MSVSDFLFNGSAPASTSTYGTSTANLPQWYNDFLQGVAAKGNAIASEPFQAYGQPRIAGFNDTQNSAFQATKDMQGDWKPAIQSGIQTVQGATQNGAAGAASPFLGQAAGMSATAAAQPYANAASQTFTGGNVAQYMNPYMQNVVDNVTTQAARGLNEKLMPGINQDFIKAGQYGSTRMMGEVGNALRDTTEGMTNQIGQLYNQGYQQAQQAFTSDANRQGQLASTMGGLTNTQQGNIANIGQVAGNMQNADNATAINAGSKLGDLATAGQATDLKDAAALQAVGNQQQQQSQSNLDMAYNDYQQQLNYPKDQLNWVSNLIKGYQMPTSTTSTSTATQPTGSSGTNLGSITGGLGALLAAFGGKAKGGAVTDQDRKMAQAAMALDADVRSGAFPARRGALSSANAARRSKPKGGLSAVGC